MSNAPKKVYLDADAEAGDGIFQRCFETAKPCNEPAIEYTLTADVEAMIREAVQAERDACLAIIEDMKSEAAITAAERARYTAMQASNASFNECRHRIRGRSRGEQE